MSDKNELIDRELEAVAGGARDYKEKLVCSVCKSFTVGYNPASNADTRYAKMVLAAHEDECRRKLK